MHCKACERSVVRALSKVKGIKLYINSHDHNEFFWVSLVVDYVYGLDFHRGGDNYHRHE